MEKKKIIAKCAADKKPLGLGEWLDFWLENYSRPGIRQSTYEIYRAHLDNHLIPRLGDIPLEELSAAQIQQFLNELLQDGNCKSRQRGLAPSTIVCIRNLLKAALEQAVLEERIPRNPARQTRPPKVEQPEMNVLSQEELRLFLSRSAPSRYYAAYVLALTTGLRRGEVLGLPWRGICLGPSWEQLDQQLPWQKLGELPLWDTEALWLFLRRKKIQLRGDPYITITQQLADLRSGPQLNLPKTRRSQRVLGIPRDTALILLYHRSLQRMEQELWGDCYNPEGLVFCDRQGQPLEPRNFTRLFQRDLARCGVRKVRFHDLRHTVATLLLEEGKAINTVQEMLGHYNPAFTAAQYGHVTARMQQDATETLGQALRRARS